MTDEPISLGARLGQLAAQRGNLPAVTDQDRTVTWAQLDRRTNQIARGLQAAGVKVGDLVTIGLANSVDFIEACYGLWKVGATPQPISHRLPAAEAQAVMDLAGTPILISGPSVESDRPRFDVPTLLALGKDDSPLPDITAPVWKAPTSRRLNRPAQTDPVGRRGRLYPGRGGRLQDDARRHHDHARAALS